MTHAAFINLTTGKAHAEPLADAPAPKIVIPVRSQQAIAFGFFRTGAVITVTGTATDDVFTSQGHGLNDGDGFIFLDLEGGFGLVVDMVRYFARDTTADTFKASRTPGGAAVNFSSNATEGTFRLSTLPQTITGWDGGKLVIKAVSDGSVLLLTADIVESGSGATARYTATWTALTSTSPAADAFLAGHNLPRVCFAELEWIDDDGKHRVSFPIKLQPAFNSDDDGAPPEYGSPASVEWLKSLALLYTEAQTLTSEQREQALENLGITISEEGRLTFHNGFWIDLNAPL